MFQVTDVGPADRAVGEIASAGPASRLISLFDINRSIEVEPEVQHWEDCWHAERLRNCETDDSAR